MPYYFNLPTFNDLTARQKAAVTQEGAISLSGGPGTGKSVVSVLRHISNYQNDIRKSVLLTYTKSLRFFLAKSAESRSLDEVDEGKKGKIKIASDKVYLANSWSGSQYEEIIIDEAQDLPEIEMVKLTNKLDLYDIIYKPLNTFDPPLTDNQYEVNLNGKSFTFGRWKKGCLAYIIGFSDFISYGADNKQILYPEKATREERLKELLPENSHHTLFQNFRNTYEILMLVRSVLNIDIPQATLDRLIADNRRGPKPVLKIGPNQNEAILDIINDFNDGVNNIAILFPFINQVKEACAYFKSKNIIFTNYTNHDEHIVLIENIHITTFKSAKGLEFNVVIIPDFGSYKKFINNYNVVQEEDYNVAFTRARTNLFLLSSHDLDISTEVLEREKFEITPLKKIIPISAVNNYEDLPF